MSETKKCNKCGETKELSAFYMRNGKPRLPCKKCSDAQTNANKAKRVVAPPREPDLEGTKVCSRCEVEKPKTEFYIYKQSGQPWGYCKACTKTEHKDYYDTHKEEMTAANKAWEAANPEKVAQYKKDWAANNPEKSRQASLDYYYRNQEQEKARTMKWKADNPDRAAFNRAASRYGMTREQWDALPPHCEICGKTEGKFAVDHDHDTGAIRGKLCYGCNTALAFFDETSSSFRGRRDEIQKAARAYMFRHYQDEIWK